MIQREVARRLCAPQGSSEGGSFSLFLQYYMKPELLFDVPPEKFLPRSQGDLRRNPLRPAGAARRGCSGRGLFLQSDAGRLPAAAQDPGQQPLRRPAGDSQGIHPTGHRRYGPACRRPGEQLTLEDFAALSAALGREADGD